MLLFNRSLRLGALALALAGCGGGGVGSPRSEPLEVQPSSYLNFKGVGLTPQNLPEAVAGNGTTARAFGDFAREGRLDLITATLTYSVVQPIASATPSSLLAQNEQWLCGGLQAPQVCIWLYSSPQIFGC